MLDRDSCLPVLGSAPELNHNRLCPFARGRKTVNDILGTRFVAILIRFIGTAKPRYGATRGPRRG